MTKLIDLCFSLLFLLLAIGCTIMAFVQMSGVFMFYAIASYILAWMMYREFRNLYKDA